MDIKISEPASVPADFAMTKALPISEVDIKDSVVMSPRKRSSDNVFSIRLLISGVIIILF